MTQIFDTHAHYDDEAFDQDREELLKQLPEKGIARVVNVGAGLASCKRTAGLMADYDYIYGAMGVHPEETAGLQEGDMDWLGQQCRLDKCVAVGEIGLDYYWEENPPREHQRRVFRDQMALARERGLPVIVHDREAHGDCLSIIREFPQVRGVFHCFSGSAEMARELVGLGWMISFTGVLTYKNARKAVEAAQAVPLDHIMIETDSPYMAPIPHRGERNHSGYVCHVCERLAELKGITADECSTITQGNGRRLFHIQA